MENSSPFRLQRRSILRILVTGAAGFVGSHIVDACFKRNHDVRVIVRKSSDLSYLKSISYPLEFFYGDLEDQRSTDEACKDIDVIIHSAGRVTEVGTYDDFFRANVLATRNLLNSARSQGVSKFVFVSSPSIFASYEDQIDIDESIPYPKVFANFYAQTKAISEAEVLQANSAKLMTCALRPRGVWGLRDKSGFIPKLLLGLEANKIKHLAKGKRVMASLCHVQNIAEACLDAANSQKVGGQAYFINDDEPVAVWELMDKVGAMYGLEPVRGEVHPKILETLLKVIEFLWSFPFIHSRYAPPLSRYSAGLLTMHGTYSTAKAKRDFDYRPRVTLESGLKEIHDWSAANGGLKALTKYVS